MIYFQNSAGLEIATDMVANATNIFSMATKNSGLVATLETRFLYDLDLNKRVVETNIFILSCFIILIKKMCQIA